MHGPEREPAVDRDRPVRDRLAPPFDRREVGDHRPGADEERGLAEAAEDAHRDAGCRGSTRAGTARRTPRRRTRRRSRACGARSGPRAGRRTGAAAPRRPRTRRPRCRPASVSPPSSPSTNCGRTGSTMPSERKYSAPAARDRQELGRQQPRALSGIGDGRAQPAAAAANSSARVERRPLGDHAPVLHHLARLREPEHARDPAAPLEDRDEARRRRATRARPPCGRRPQKRPATGSSRRTGPTRRTAPARTARRRVAVAAQQALARRTRPARPRWSSARSA